MKQITVTKALSDVKVLTDRIEKETGNLSVLGIKLKSITFFVLFAYSLEMQESKSVSSSILFFLSIASATVYSFPAIITFVLAFERIIADLITSLFFIKSKTD